jgi:hypothetical protein
MYAAGTSLLVIQPTGSGKGQYARELAKNPKTLVLLVTPYRKLKNDALESGVAIDKVDFQTVHETMQATGLLTISSYESVAKYRAALTSIKQKGVRCFIVFDEIHSMMDSQEEKDGYRDFRNIWTLIAAVQPSFVLGLTATLRPRHEVCVANAIGLSKWDEAIRASCMRPGVSCSFHVYENESSALQALVHFKPQLVCVRTKNDVDRLCADASLKKAYTEILPHFKELSSSEKVVPHSYMLFVLKGNVGHTQFFRKTRFQNFTTTQEMCL